MKVLRKFQFEHCWFIYSLMGLIITPWFVTLFFCHHPLVAFHSVGSSLLLKANLFSLGWGVANVLCGICFLRIGFALTGGILAGLGISIGVTVPMIVKASGLFSQAPNLGSLAGHTVLLGVAVMLVGVVLVSFAGFGRDRAIKTPQPSSGNFRTGLVMVVISGVLSVGMSFSFIYSQGPIVSALKAQGSPDIPATFAVWAVSLMGGALVNVLYPAYLMTKNRSWSILLECWGDVGKSILIGVSFFVAVCALGKGMLLLGSLGASVGFGIQQAAQMLGSQGVGFIGGEWRGVTGKPMVQMYAAILLLIFASMVLAYANTLAKT